MALIPNPPLGSQTTDANGKSTQVWNSWYVRLQAIINDLTTDFAPTNATYITNTANTSLSNEQPLSVLSTGFVKVATATGQLSSTGNSTIRTADIEDLNITTGKINDLAVTTGKIAGDAITNAKIADAQVSLEHLDSGIAPSHFVAYAGTFTTVGGDSSETITVTGCTASDLAFVMMKTRGATPTTITRAEAKSNSIDVIFAADPSNDHVIVYQVLRTAS
jgi:hypothetical protein